MASSPSSFIGGTLPDRAAARRPGILRLLPSASGAGKPVRGRRGRATVTGIADPGSQDTAPTRALVDGTRHPEEVVCSTALSAAQLRRPVMRRLLLVRHASTDAVRAAAFGADEPLDEAGRGRGRPPARAAAVADRRGRGEPDAARPRDGRAAPGLPRQRRGPRAVRMRLRPLDRTDAAAMSPTTDPQAVRGVDDRAGRRAARRRVPDRAARARARVARRSGRRQTGRRWRSPTPAWSRPPSSACSRRRPRRSGGSTSSPVAITELHAHDGRWTITRVNDREAPLTAFGDRARRGRRPAARRPAPRTSRGGFRARGGSRSSAPCTGRRGRRARYMRRCSSGAVDRRRRGRRARARRPAALALLRAVAPVDGARRALAGPRGAGARRLRRGGRHRRCAWARDLARRPRPGGARRPAPVRGGDRVGGREHGRRGAGAAAVDRGRRRARRARAPRGQHARRHGRQPQRALRALRHRGGARRRRRQLAGGAGRRGADGVPPSAATRAARRGPGGATPPAHPSPNAGVAEAAFAGALGVRLGGTLAYAGRVEHRPVLGRRSRARARATSCARSGSARAVVRGGAGLGRAGGAAMKGALLVAGHRVGRRQERRLRGDLPLAAAPGRLRRAVQGAEHGAQLHRDRRPARRSAARR